MSSIEHKGPLDSLKKELLINAKREAVNEIFGEFIRSFAKVEDFSLTEDVIKASSIGLIRIKNDPIYSQGRNLGEICVKIDAYVRREDLEKFKPKKRSKKVCLSEGDVKTIRKRAEQKARLEVLTDYHQGITEYPLREVLPLLHEVRYSEGGFVQGSQVYCVRATGVIYPIEVMTFIQEQSVQAPRETLLGSSRQERVSDAGQIWEDSELKIVVEKVININRCLLGMLEFTNKSKGPLFLDVDEYSCHMYDETGNKWKYDQYKDTARLWAGKKLAAGSSIKSKMSFCSSSSHNPAGNLVLFIESQSDYSGRYPFVARVKGIKVD